MIQVIYDATHPDLQDCPIGCIRSQEVIIINPDLFYPMRAFDQQFWLLHEEGHIKLNTSDEVLADSFAFDALVGSQFRSLKQICAALDSLLVGSNPEFERRKSSLMDRAIRWDATH